MQHMVEGEVSVAAPSRPKASEKRCLAAWFSVAECKAKRDSGICELLCATDDTSMSCSSIGGFLFFGRAVGHERPASVWQLDEMRQMVVDTKATTWAVFQCQYGGLSPKPTRFVSNIPHAKSLKYAKWPSFTNVGQ